MSEPFIGEIRALGFNFVPRGWAACDGQLMSIAQHQALFSLLGTIYGGDGRTTFALPDLRGRTAISDGTGPGLTNRRMGQQIGNETTVLTTNHMPPHNHSVTVQAKCKAQAGNTNDAVNHVWADDAGGQSATYSDQAPDSDMGANATSVTEATVGGGQHFSNMQPSLVVNYCIALDGIYPSRN